jgi:glycosyltransferase involved in cell wall biosynthesis
VPQVSVCIPAHNAAVYLPRAIDSALAQDYDDFELIVLDNASTDGTRAVCDGYDDPRFRYEFEAEPGQSIAWNRCLDLAGGKYVILLHADDELRPQFLSRAVELMDQNEDVDLVHCAAQHVDEEGAPLQLQAPFDTDLLDREGVVLRRLLLKGCIINPAGVIVRRSAYEAVGRFTDRVVWGVDWHMWIRVAMLGAVGYLAEPLSLYREHTTSGTSGVMASARNGQDERWVIDDVFRIIRVHRPELDGLHRAAIRGVAERTWWMAELMCQEGEMGASRAGLRRAVGMRPGLLAKPRTWALLAATYLGYDSFERARGLKRRSQAPRRTL